jgi:protein phosphatase
VGFRFVSAAKSDKGKVRASNQDGGYAGVNLFIVADGMGGHAGGDIASAVATQHVAQYEDAYPDSETATAALLKGMKEANQKLTETVSKYRYLAGMGTTLDSLVFTGNMANVVHIGDSRVYLLRDGILKQVTKDHTFVQKLIDAGRITEEEALYHPRRNVLLRVLGDSSEEPEFDVHQFEIEAGDRFLLCSDGLYGYVPQTIMYENMRVADLEEASDLLVAETREYGAPDNVTVILIDVEETDEIPQTQSITWLGSAANEVAIKEGKGPDGLLEIFSPIRWYESLRERLSREEYRSEKDPLLNKAIAEFDGKVRRFKIRGAVLAVLISVLVIGGVWAVYSYTQTRYYLGVQDGKVAIYQGIKESFGGFGFSHLYEKSSVSVTDLPSFQQELLSRTISADNLTEAKTKLSEIVMSISHG